MLVCWLFSGMLENVVPILERFEELRLRLCVPIMFDMMNACVCVCGCISSVAFHYRQNPFYFLQFPFSFSPSLSLIYSL